MNKHHLSRKKILEMVRNDGITPEQGLQFLKAFHQENSEVQTPHDLLFYSHVWEHSEIDISSRKLSGTVLLFDFNEKLRDILENHPEKPEHMQVILVKPERAFTKSENDVYGIRPGQIEDYHRLIQHLENRNLFPDKIVHLWHQDKIGEIELHKGIYPVFYLTRALMKQKPRKTIHLLYIITVDQGMVHRENWGYASGAAMSGFGKTVRLENPKFIYKTVEVLNSPSTNATSLPDNSHLIDILVQELQAKADHVEIQYKKGTRFVKRFQELAFSGEDKEFPWREHGVFLITGGIGGLGVIFAEHLARQAGARLVLTGRSELTPEKRAKIQHLESLGSEVIYVKSDVSIKADVEALIAEIKGRFNGIHGIIHSAGLHKDSFIIKKTEQEMEEVLRAKVYGTLYLDNATKDESLDFFVLFSSIASVIGSVGQCDYAYANSFLDNFVIIRENLRQQYKRTGKTLAINWPLWKQGGMKMDRDTEKILAERMGIIPLDTASGVYGFTRGLATEHSQLIVIKGNREKIRRVLNLPFPPSEIPPKTEQTAINFGLLFEKTENFLKRILSEETKLPVKKIDSYTDFENYGIDSIIVGRFNARIEKEFGSLPKTLLFEYQNLYKLSEYFIETYQAELLKLFGLNASVITSEKILKTEESVDASRIEIEEPRHSAKKMDRIWNFLSSVAIIGISGRYPLANNLEQYWEHLKSGNDCITEIPEDRWDFREYYDPDPEKANEGKIYCKWGGFLEDVDKFDPLFFNISPREADLIDPQERLFLETVWHALEDAGYTRKQIQKYVQKEHTAVGVFVGTTTNTYLLWGPEEWHKGNLVFPNSYPWSVANRISYVFNFHGPSIHFDTACSSSLTAVHYAYESLRKGECHLAIAGGVNVYLHPLKYIGMCRMRMLSKTGRCSTFGEQADGFVPGEGVGAIVLKPLEAAIRDRDTIYAVIKGSAVNHDGKTYGYTVPNPNAQTQAIQHALETACINPHTISYVEAHGTGTSLGDPIEIAGLTKAFRNATSQKQYCAIGSSKSNIGHLESAAGIAGITKIVLQMQHKRLVPSLYADPLNPRIDFENSPFYVQRELSEWRQPEIDGTLYPRRAGISSFGAGGSNVHLLLEEWIPAEREMKRVKDPSIKAFTESSTDDSRLIFVLSAKNDERMKTYTQKWLNFLAPTYSAKTGSTQPDDKEVFQQLQHDILVEFCDILAVTAKDVDVTEHITDYGLDHAKSAQFANRINKKFNLELHSATILKSLSLKAFTQDVFDNCRDSLIRFYHSPEKKRDSLSSTHRLIGSSDSQFTESLNHKLPDIAYTLQVGREAMETRLAIIFETEQELREKLSRYLHGETYLEGMYTGQVGEKSFQLLSADEDAKAMIQRWGEKGKLSKLAELWVNGGEIEWETLSFNRNRRRIPLPTYPFEKKRCWIPETVKPPHKPVSPSPHDTGHLLYIPQWIPAPLPSPAPMTRGKRLVLIFSFQQETGLERLLANHHKADQVIEIILGHENRRFSPQKQEIDLEEQEAFDTCMTKIVERFSPIRCNGSSPALIIYFLGGIHTQMSNIENLEKEKQHGEQSIFSLLRLVKALDRQGLGSFPLRLTVVTNGVYEHINPYGAGVHGLAKSVAKEYYKWEVSAINSPSQEIREDDERTHALISAIAAETGENKGESVSLRNGIRYIRAIYPIELPTSGSPFKDQGVYLIIGGTGGIGSAFSLYLAETVKAKLILLGRSQPNDWTKALIAQIESKGGKVLYLQADITKPDSLKKAVKHAKAHFGKIHGVIHSAVVIEDVSIAMFDEARFHTALAPHIKGSLILYDVLRDEPLDFLVFFSSGASFYAGVGRSAYVTGSCFKDAFALWLNQHARYPVKVIDWGYWGSIGLGKIAGLDQRFTARGLKILQPHEGMEALTRTVAQRIPQILAMKADENFLRNMGVDLDYTVLAYPEKSPPLLTRCKKHLDTLWTPDLSLHQEAYTELTRFCQSLLLNVFQNMGVFRHSTEQYSREALGERLHIISEYKRLYDTLLETLCYAGFIQREEETIRSTSQIDAPELHNVLKGLEARKNRLIKQFPEIAPHVNLVWLCAGHLPAILQGEKLATDIIFPNPSMTLVEKIYKGTPVADHFNHLVVVAVQSYVEARLESLQDGEKITILEVGAGIGGTSALLLAMLKTYEGRLRYVYTDISPGFVQYGKKIYGQEYSFVEFNTLNIEKYPLDQGYSQDEFEVVIGANVVHATRKIKRTLQHLKSLLKTNGVLILNEVTGIHEFGTLTFGLLKGWWLYADEDNRLPNSPLLDKTTWERVLQEEGFEQVVSYGIPEDHGTWWSQHVILAESNGCIKVEVSREDRPRMESPAIPPVVCEARPQPESLSPSRSQPPQDNRRSLEDTLTETICDVLQIEKQTLDVTSPFVDFGLDSILGVEAVDKINEKLSITLRTSDLFSYSTIAALAEHIMMEFGDVIRSQKDQERGEPVVETDMGSDQLQEDEETREDQEEREIVNLLYKFREGELSIEEIEQVIEEY